LVLSFQGTDPTDVASVSRDLDRGSAGIKRIRQQYFHIIQALTCKLEASSDNVNLVICGHSLGGADAQNFFTALLASLSSLQSSDALPTSSTWQKFTSRERKLDANALNKIGEVHLYAYNAAGIRKSTESLASSAVERLKNKGITISVNHQRVQHDIVHTVGEATLHDFDASTVTVRSLFFDGREKLFDRLTTAHTDRQLFGKTIGGHLYEGGDEGRKHIKSLHQDLFGRSEPDTKLYHQLKQTLQTGSASNSFSS